MHFLSRTATALALSGACFLAGAGTALAAQTASLSIDATPSDSSASISPLLYGIFLEDINFAVDGGMYAELIKNGSFEYGMLAKNSGKVITYDTLISHVWGPYADDNNRILRVNMANIRRKIELNPAQPEYLFTEVGIGYRILESNAL